MLLFGDTELSMPRRASSRIWWLLLAAAAVGLAAAGAQRFAARRAAARPGLRLTRELANATQVPTPSAQRVYLHLERVPSEPTGAVFALPFSPQQGRPVVFRALIRSEAARVTLRTLSGAEASAHRQAFSAGPDVPGVPIPACTLSPPGRSGWSVCQWFGTFHEPRLAGLLLIEGDRAAVRDVEILQSDLAPSSAPLSPALRPLVRYVPQADQLSVSYREELVAEGASRYLFDLALPPEGELRVSLGRDPDPQGPGLRFRALLDGAVLLDEVVTEPGWKDRVAPLPAGHGPAGRLVLETIPQGSGAAGGWGEPRIVAKSDRPSILLITTDAVRPDHLSAYGYGRDTSPTLRGFAAAGVRFDRATAQGARTWTSVVSLLTGLYPVRNGVRVAGAALPTFVRTLPDFLSEAGYETWTGGDLAGFPPYMLDRFDEVDLAYIPLADNLPRSLLAGKTLLQFAAVAKRMADRPTFAWIHLEDAHYPLQPSEPLRFGAYQGRFADQFTLGEYLRFRRAEQLTPSEHAHLAALYDAAVHDADATVKGLLEILDQAGASGRTIVVITSDHGEMLDEHGVTLDHSTPFDSVLHVPLLIAWPGHIAGGRTVPDRVQLVDLAPTLLGLASVPLPLGLDGRDLGPLLRGGSLPGRPAFAEVQLGSVNLARVVYLGDDKLIASNPGSVVEIPGVPIPVPTRGLFDVKLDPGELHNLAESNPARVQELVELLKVEQQHEREDAPDPASAPIGQAALQAMRQAGYLDAEAAGGKQP